MITPGNGALDVVQVRLLGRGRHLHPRKGGCLMELVSATLGGPWTDHPICTPPVLAHLARVVNDLTGTEARPRLAPLIPYLISSVDPAAEYQADLAVCASVLSTAANVAPADVVGDLGGRFRQLTNQTEHRRAGGRERRRLMAITDRALRLTCDATDRSVRDDTAYDVLVTAVNAQRTAEHLLPVVPTGDSGPSIHDRLTVLTWLTRPVGADWFEVEAEVDPSCRPDWLIAARDVRPEAASSA
jgi:hypothetical protein